MKLYNATLKDSKEYNEFKNSQLYKHSTEFCKSAEYFRIKEYTQQDLLSSIKRLNESLSKITPFSRFSFYMRKESNYCIEVDAGNGTVELTDIARYPFWTKITKSRAQGSNLIYSLPKLPLFVGHSYLVVIKTPDNISVKYDSISNNSVFYYLIQAIVFPFLAFPKISFPILALLVAALLFYDNVTNIFEYNKKYNNAIEAGDKFMEVKDYEKAGQEYDKALTYKVFYDSRIEEVDGKKAAMTKAIDEESLELIREIEVLLKADYGRFTTESTKRFKRLLQINPKHEKTKYYEKVYSRKAM